MTLMAHNRRKADAAAARTSVRAVDALAVLEHAPRSLRELPPTRERYLAVLRVRAVNPNASIPELAKSVGMTADGFASRLRRAFALADELEKW